MGNDDNKTSNDKLYLTTADGYRVQWRGLQSVSLATDEVYHEPIAINLKSIEGTMTFTVKNPYLSRLLFRRIRRWSRKKAQQKKRKIAKENKHDLLHNET